MSKAACHITRPWRIEDNIEDKDLAISGFIFLNFRVEGKSVTLASARILDWSTPDNVDIVLFPFPLTNPSLKDVRELAAALNTFYKEVASYLSVLSF